MKKLAIFIAIALAVASLGFVALNAEEITTTTSSVETTSWAPRYGGMMGGYGGMMGGYYNTTSGTNTYYYGGMMGGYYNTNTDGTYLGCHGTNVVDITSYEFLYAHLSDADQATVDAKYLELLLLVDFDILSTEDQLIAIDTIKTQLVEFIETEGFVTTYYRP